MKLGLECLKTASKLFNCCRKNAKSASKVVEQPKKELFCHQYWNWAKEDMLLSPKNTQSVSLHGELHSINHHFVRSAHPEHMDMPSFSKLTPREMITKSDFEFKRLPPIEEDLYVYRSIGEKPEFFAEYKMYKKLLDVKKGDKITMREYAYATSDKSYADVYLTNNKGVRYEIEVPKGSRVSRIGYGINDEVVFPRSSKFECIGVEKICDDKNDFLKVNLRYLMPEEL